MAAKKKQIKNEFVVGDFVGAKVKGFSIWPGKIEKVETLSHNRKKYTVRFFRTNDISSNLVELKPFAQVKPSAWVVKNAKLAEALVLCRKELEGCSETEIVKETLAEEKCNDEQASTSVDEESKLTIDESIQNEEKVAKNTERPTKKIRLDKRKEVITDDKQAGTTPRQRKSHLNRISEVDIQQREEPEKNDTNLNKTPKSFEADEVPTTVQPNAKKPSETKSSSRRASSRKSLPISSIEIKIKLETRAHKRSRRLVGSDQEISGPIMHNSSNNDLMIEKGTGDSLCRSASGELLNDKARNDHSLSKSAIDHNSRLSIDEDNKNVIQNPTIEKLKKKLATKMQEKEALKMIRLQKKEYQSASKKFPTVHKKLDYVLSLSERLLKEDLADKITTSKLEDAHKNLEATLLKCIDKLTTDYGRTQEDRIKFHKTLFKIISNLKEVRDTLREQKQDLARIFVRLLKVYKTNAIRDFINDQSINRNLDDAMNERKENDAIKLG